MTTTSRSTRRLSEVTTYLVYPQDRIVTTGWPRIKRRLEDMRVRYDGWQQGVAQIALGHDADGRYVCTVGGVTMSVPRQVGKTFTLGSLLVAMCLEYPGLRVVWTSHHLRTTTNTFRSMQAMVRQPRVFEHLAENGIRVANGEQEIKFDNGSIIMFGAREHGFGVGIDAIDVLVCDEAQRLTSRSLADMVPTTNQARHKHGALLFFIGTPPRPTDQGDEFAARREKALSGKLLNGVYVEMSADRDGDIDDPEQWAKANASYPHRTPHESMLRMREQLNDDGDWRREGLGIWDSFDQARPISLKSWDDLALPDGVDPPMGQPSYYALAMSPQRVGAIAVSVPTSTGRFVDLAELDRIDDTRVVVDWLVKRCGSRTPVAIDSRDPAASLINELRERKVKVNAFTSVDCGKATGSLLTAIAEGTVSHAGQPAISMALATAGTQPVGRVGGKAGVWEWVFDATAETTALRALTMAHFGSTFASRPASTRVRRLNR